MSRWQLSIEATLVAMLPEEGAGSCQCPTRRKAGRDWPSLA